MILDSSAIAAICLGEPGAEEIQEHLESARDIKISAATMVEAAVVTDARRPGAFDTFRRTLNLTVIPVDAEQAEFARAAYQRFGRGSGHPARLDFGDCFVYALARQIDEPVLFTGDDFAHRRRPCDDIGLSYFAMVTLLGAHQALPSTCGTSRT